MTNESLQRLFTLPMDEQLRLFGDMRSLYPTRVVRCGRTVSELVRGKPLDLIYRSDGKDRNIEAFMQRYRAAGLLILKRAEVVCERYAMGQTRETPWISFSMAKSARQPSSVRRLKTALLPASTSPSRAQCPSCEVQPTRGSASEMCCR